MLWSTEKSGYTFPSKWLNSKKKGSAQGTPESTMSKARELLDEILVDAYGDAEQHWSLLEALENRIKIPSEAEVVGEPIQVLSFDYNGNARSGIMAKCSSRDGSEHEVAAFDLVFPIGTDAADLIAAYRSWLGLESSQARKTKAKSKKRPKAPSAEFDLSQPIDLIVLAPKQQSARCRILGSDDELNFRTGQTWSLVSGEIVTVHPEKHWRYGGYPYLSGDIQRHRLDIGALNLSPLQLLDEWPWDPSEEYWGEEDEPINKLFQPIIERGVRSSFEMEYILPGADPKDPYSDPILEAVELGAAGDFDAAERILGELLTADLRCLDAHAHLGNYLFDRHPEKAIRHYEVGFRIGEVALGSEFDGLLPWRRLRNRPFLRCLHGFGLCLWRLGRRDEADSIFERMLWLNPSDNQGIRFLLPQLRNGKRWEDSAESWEYQERG